jgi:hypothetical protein
MRAGFFKKYGRVSEVPERRNKIRYHKVALHITFVLYKGRLENRGGAPMGVQVFWGVKKR